MTTPTLIIPANRAQFLDLRADGTESIMLTFNSGDPLGLTGPYVYKKNDEGKDPFCRHREGRSVIDTIAIVCDVQNLRFDRTRGVLLDKGDYKYTAVGTGMPAEYKYFQGLTENGQALR